MTGAVGTIAPTGATTMAEHTGPQATVLPDQPAVLLIGDQRIPIDPWPLARSVEEYRSLEVSRPSDGVLLIGPKKRAAAGVIIPGVLVVLGGALPTALAIAFEAPWWLSLLFGLVVLFFLVVLVRSALSHLRWVRFDQRTGQLVIEGRVGFRREPRVERTYPLATVRAVQLLHNGWHSITEPQGAGEQQTISHRAFFGYELNLVLDDPQQPRLHLFSLSDWQWIRQTGQSIGEFLGVPVLDRLYHGA
jgi:hypothetical protein